MVTIGLLIIGAILSGCTTFGGDHTAEDQQRYAASPNYRATESRFVNDRQEVIDQMKEAVFSLKNIRKNLFSGEHLTPDTSLPEVQPETTRLLEEGNTPKVIWFGHSSFLIRMAGKTLLIDPVFGSAGPFPFFGGRFQDSVVQVHDLPEIDVVLISHDHFDHLEMDTVKFFVNRQTKFVVPLGVAVHLKHWGIRQDHITEMDWWEETTFDELTVVMTPSRHYSGRSGLLANDTLWSSYALKDANHSLYFSGDSGYGEHFKEIGDKLGPFDLAFMENGQYHDISREIHMHPEDGIQAFKDLKAKVFFPIHWGMFSLARHSWYEPVVRISQLAKAENIPLYVPKIGEMIILDQGFTTVDWWSALIAER